MSAVATQAAKPRVEDIGSWPEWRRREIDAAMAGNGKVGSVLVSETDRVRVWTISISPGERLPMHKHVLDYFWTATAAGASRSHFWDGRITETSYAPGDTRHYQFGAGEFMSHDLENIGQTLLGFVTVELKQSANEPLRLGWASIWSCDLRVYLEV